MTMNTTSTAQQWAACAADSALIALNPFFDGVQRIYRFPNNFGASVVRYHGSYGGDEGQWELAVIKFSDNSNSFKLTYDTPITTDVLGWLSDAVVSELLDEIKALRPVAEYAFVPALPLLV